MNALLGKHPEFDTMPSKQRHTGAVFYRQRQNLSQMRGIEAMTDGLHTPLKPSGIKNGLHIRRFVTDALAGMGLFVLGTLLTTGSGAAAAAV